MIRLTPRAVVRRCSCHRCREGLHTKVGRALARRKHRAYRHAAKIALRKGQEPERVYPLGYTD